MLLHTKQFLENASPCGNTTTGRTDTRGRYDLLSWKTASEHDHRKACSWSHPKTVQENPRMGQQCGAQDWSISQQHIWNAKVKQITRTNKAKQQQKSINESCKLRGWMKKEIKMCTVINRTFCVLDNEYMTHLTCVNTRFSELRLSRLRTKRIDWKRSWMLALNCSSSIPQVALEYRIRDWTMNLNRYSRAWREQDAVGDITSAINSLTVNKHLLG